MNYVTYKEYKDSNIYWVGEIPKHWEFHRIKDYLNFKIGGTPSTSEESYFEGENIWVSISDLSSIDSEYISDSAMKISDDGVRYSNVKKISKGSLLFSFKLSVGLTAFADCDLYTNEAIASFEPNEYIDLKFLKYVLNNGFENNAFENIYGAKLFNTDLIKFAKFVMPMDLNEQKKIANYLDKNIKEIDDNISKNNELISLLEEKKVALINQCVTKGLNPDVPMKDSGIDIVGEIPNEWDFIPIHHFVNLITDYVSNGSFASLRKNVEYLDEKDYAILIRLADNTNNFSGPFVYINKEAYNFLRKTKLKEGDVILSNIGATLGTIFKVPDLNQPMSLGPNVLLIKFNNMINGEYFYQWFKSDFGQYFIKLITTQTTQPKFNKTDFRKLPILCPPLNQQKEIINKIKQISEKYDKIISKIYNKIILLKEYKTSLIYHAVTGKIDVREVEL